MSKTWGLVANVCFLLLPLAGACYGGYLLWRDVNRKLIQINQQPVGQVDRTERIVQRQIASRNIWEQATAGLSLYPGDKIRTGDNSAVRIALRSGDVIDMGANSFITLELTKEGSYIQVERGVVIPIVSTGALSLDTSRSTAFGEEPPDFFTDFSGLEFGSSGQNSVMISTIRPTVGLSFSNMDFSSDAQFSPNGDGEKDIIRVYLNVPNEEGIDKWELFVGDSTGVVWRAYGGTQVPPRWIDFDGKDDRGQTLPEGTYQLRFQVQYRDGYIAGSLSPYLVLDLSPPTATVATEYPVFSPNNDGRKDTMIFAQTSSQEGNWVGEIRPVDGSPEERPVRTFRFAGGLPPLFPWNGMTDSGAPAPDGDYIYQVFSTDQAGNTGYSEPVRFTLSTIQTPVQIATDYPAFSPGTLGGRDTLNILPEVEVNQDISSWKVGIQNREGETVKTFEGSGPVPAQLTWDGLTTTGGQAPDGSYTTDIHIVYNNGNEPTAKTGPFLIDTVHPQGEYSIPYTVFSPNGDGLKDTVPFNVQTEGNDRWIGAIQDVQGNTVRSWTWIGAAPEVVWDGRDSQGKMLPDGDYLWTLSSTDEAGNSNRSTPGVLRLETFDTPVSLALSTQDFSPAAEGERGTLRLYPYIGVNHGIDDWKISIRDGGGLTVWSQSGQGEIPPEVRWNGNTSEGVRTPDGTYRAEIQVRYEMGNEPAARSLHFLLETVPPWAEVSTDFTLFSPNGDGLKDYLLINTETRGDDPWRAVIRDTLGQEIYSWTWKGPAKRVVWDGMDFQGQRAPDGTYQFSLSSTDRAGNHTEKTLDHIVLDARIPTAIVSSSAGVIAPRNGYTIRLETGASIRQDIDGWWLELRDPNGRLFRRFPEGEETVPFPASIPWDGMDAQGQVVEGWYAPNLCVIYDKGDVVTADAPRIAVDKSGPSLRVSISPEYFSPDGDGEDDQLIISLEAKDVSPIATWSFEIREPPPSNAVFYSMEGRGSPELRSVWNGRSNRGELVQSATDYPYSFTATDILGNSSTTGGKIGVDVLVIREGDRLRINVPSIVFRADQADFVGLPAEVVENNNRILRRIAQILNKFPTYRVQVEGHANPVSGTAEEENTQLQPLSERRAQATVDFLVNFGVDRRRLSAVGMGGKRPVVPAADRNDWWKNRRVEFILLK